MENKDNGAQRKDSFFVGQNVENMNVGLKSPDGSIDNTGPVSAPVGAASAGGGKKKIIFFILVIFLVLAGVAIFYFVTKASPQEIMKASVAEMKKVKSSSYNGVLSFNLQASENKEKTPQAQEKGVRFVEPQFQEIKVNVGIEISGKQDTTDAENPKGDMNLKIKSGFSAEGGSYDFSADTSYATLGKKKVYLKLNDYDLGAVGFMYGGVLSPFKGKWYYVDVDKANEMNSGTNTEVLELNKKILALYEKYEFIAFKKDLGDDKIGDLAVYHYEVALDRKAVVDFYLDILKEVENIAREKGTLDGEAAVSLEKAKNVSDKAGGMLDEIINNVKAEVWIGKKDKIMHRITLNGKFDENFNKTFFKKFAELIESDSASVPEDVNISDDFSVDFSLADINEPVIIEEPADAVDFQEALAGMMGSPFGGPTPIPEKYVNVDTDKDGLTDNMEKFYKTNPQKADTDGDGFKDGDEVKNGFDPLSKVKGAKLKAGSY